MKKLNSIFLLALSLLFAGQALSIETGPADYVYRIPAAGGRAKFGNTLRKVTIQGLTHNWQAKTANYTLTSTDDLITADCTGGTFTVTLPTAVSASGKSYTIIRIDASGNSVTIATTSSQTINGAAPGSLSAQYQVLVVTSNGANWISTSTTLSADETSIHNTSGTLSVKDGGVTRAKLAALGQQISSSGSGTFSTSSGSLTDVTNLSVSITTTGRMVHLALIDDNSGTASIVTVQASGNNQTASCQFAFDRGGSTLALMQAGHFWSSGTTLDSDWYPVSTFQYFDVVAAGTYTYKFQAKNLSNATCSVQHAKLVAYEL